jgi:hypothetical protein
MTLQLTLTEVAAAVTRNQNQAEAGIAKKVQRQRQLLVERVPEIFVLKTASHRCGHPANRYYVKFI